MIRKEIKEIKIYIASDGTEFLKKDECKNHEKHLNLEDKKAERKPYVDAVLAWFKDNVHSEFKEWHLCDVDKPKKVSIYLEWADGPRGLKSQISLLKRLKKAKKFFGRCIKVDVSGDDYDIYFIRL